MKQNKQCTFFGPSMVYSGMANEEKRSFLGLEILRFICALSVLFWHYRHFFVETGWKFVQGFHPSQMPFYSFFSLFYDHGHFAVRIFWLLSGFIFFWKYAAEISNHKISFLRFGVLRLSRLYPLHFITLLTVAVLQNQFFAQNNYYFIYDINNLKHFVLHLFFASSWGFQDGHSFNAPVWSVSVEILVYGTFFLLLRSFNLNIKRTASAFLLFFILYRLKVFNKVYLECITLFFYGGWIFRMYEFNREKIHRHLGLYSTVSGATLVLILSLVDFSSANVYLVKYISKTGYMVVQYFVFLPLIVAPFLLFFEMKKPRLIADKVAWLGNLTYSSYMIHFPIQILLVLIAGHLGYSRNLFLSPAVFIFFIFGTLIAGYFTFKWIEVPLQKVFRKRFI